MNKDELIHKLVVLAVDVNGFEYEKDAHRPIVFLEFSGHVHKISISFFINGWAVGRYPDYITELYTDEYYSEAGFINVIEILTKLKEKINNENGD